MADLPGIRFHNLRHTSISMLLENGTQANAVPGRAGHSKASVTADIYCWQAMDCSDKRDAEEIEDIVIPLTAACSKPAVNFWSKMTRGEITSISGGFWKGYRT